MFEEFTGLESALALSATARMMERSDALFEAFFTKEDIMFLLAPANAVGIRLYPASHAVGGNSLVGAGVQADRSDIESRYILSGGQDSNILSESMSKIVIQDNSFMQQQALTTDQHSGFFSVYFSKSMLEETLNVLDCVGVIFYCSTLELPNQSFLITPLTLTAIPVNASGEMMMVNESAAAFKSLAPCPPDCGDPKHYLNPYLVDLNIGTQPIGLNPS